MPKFKRKFNIVYASIISLLLIASGLCFIFFKQQSVVVFTILVGSAMIVSAFYSIFFTRQFLIEPLRAVVLVRSCLQLIFGALVVVYPLGIAATLYIVLLYLTSCFMIADGLTLLFQVIFYKPKGYIVSMIIEGVLLILFGILFMLKPGEVGPILLNVLGFVLIAFGICLFIFSFSKRYDLEEVKESAE